MFHCMPILLNERRRWLTLFRQHLPSATFYSLLCRKPPCLPHAFARARRALYNITFSRARARRAIKAGCVASTWHGWKGSQGMAWRFGCGLLWMLKQHSFWRGVLVGKGRQWLGRKENRTAWPCSTICLFTCSHYLGHAAASRFGALLPATTSILPLLPRALLPINNTAPARILILLCVVKRRAEQDHWEEVGGLATCSGAQPIFWYVSALYLLSLPLPLPPAYLHYYLFSCPLYTPTSPAVLSKPTKR